MLLLIAITGVVCIGVWFLLFSKPKRALPSFVKVAKDGLPIIGNGLDFVPSKLLKTTLIYPRIYGPVSLFRRFGNDTFLISDPALVREVLTRRPKVFRRRRGGEMPGIIMGFNRGLLTSNGGEWSRLRRATAPSFNTQNMRHKLSVVQQQVTEWTQHLCEQADEKRAVDMKLESFNLTIRVISAIAFGVDEDSPLTAYFFSAEFLQDVVLIFRFVSEFRYFPFPLWMWRVSPQFKHQIAGVAAAERFTTAAQNIIAEKRRQLAQPGVQPVTMVDFLLEREEPEDSHGKAIGEDRDRDTLTHDEVIANVKTFYTAGAETTSVAITWCTYILATQTAARDRLREEVDSWVAARLHGGDNRKAHWSQRLQCSVDDLSLLPYTDAFVKEVLRLYAPPVLIPFELSDLSQSVVLGSGEQRLEIHPDQEVWVNIEGAMKDPSTFPAPLCFKPERWLPSAVNTPEVLQRRENSFFTFGGGPRVCPGLHLAHLELILAVVHLCYGFDVTLDCPDQEVVRVMNFVASADKMPVRMTQRRAVASS